MKKDLFSIIKNARPFKKADALVYLLIAFLISALFLGFFLFKNKNSAQGFNVYKNDVLIITCEYGKPLSVTSGYEKIVEINDNLVTVYYSEEKTHFNVIEINHSEKWARIISSNCSSSKDCTRLPKITKNGGTLVCVPHSLIIKSSFGKINPPIVG